MNKSSVALLSPACFNFSLTSEHSNAYRTHQLMKLAGNSRDGCENNEHVNDLMGHHSPIENTYLLLLWGGGAGKQD